ncbi:MAG TPA: SRPBCC family protein [Thermoanaerobaculia bacterium]|jgi:uncharacterized protein YndB with AHSA1/START domain
MRLVIVILSSIAGLLLVAAAVIVVVGALLPERHEVSRSVTLRAAPSDVYRVITDRENAPRWRKDLKKVEMLGAQQGRPHFREHGAHGSVTYEIVEEVPGRSLVTRIVDQDLGYSGSWTYALAPAEGGTILTITEKGEVSNVVFRFMSRFVFGHTRTIDTYLAALSRHVQER